MNFKEIKAGLSKRLSVLILSAFIAFFTIGTVSGYDFGYNLYIDEICIGSFDSEKDAGIVIEKIKTEDGIDLSDRAKIVFELRANESLTSCDTACDNYRKNDSRYIEGYSLSLGEITVFSTATQEEAESIRDEFLSRFYEDGAVSVNFKEPCKIEKNYVFVNEISSVEEARELLAGVATVETVIKLSYYECIPYETVEIEDDSLYVGESITELSGLSGEKYIEYTTVKVNGETVSNYESGQFVAKEAQPCVIKKGTKHCPKGMATGKFINPCEGVLTSPFGPRWGRMHKGIDIGAPSGTPMYASDGGKVIYAGWMSGYGYLVQIDHKNGYTTYYAHCSALHVNVGDEVAQGDLIADMGSTGNSTGPHLHFEVRLNNVPQNPENYVKYR